MTAVILDRYGGPEDLVIGAIPTPEPGDEEVLIRILASSVNSWDYDLMRGTPIFVRFDGLFKPSTRIMGIDVAGIVLKTGKKVTGFQPGDEVFGDLSASGWGGFANYVCARQQYLAIKPPDMPFTHAAAIPHAGVLALQGLRKHGDIEPGMKVLFNGAGGGVGTTGLQICKSLGAEVTCVDKADKLAKLEELGADFTFDYEATDFTAAGKTYDLIIDVVANRSPIAYRSALKKGGRFVMIGGTPSALLKAVLSRNRDRKIEILAHKPDPADLYILTEWYSDGRYMPIIDREFALEDVPEAMRYFGTGNAFGKVVISQIL